jgi:transposase
MSTVTVLASPERRRRWTPTEKQRIVEESFAADTTVADVARRHDIHPNLLHLWRRHAKAALAARPYRLLFLSRSPLHRRWHADHSWRLRPVRRAQGPE